jgi:hypothetical protein
MFKWQDPQYTLGERCVFFSENEMKNGVAEDKPNSFTSPRIREYFSIATRFQNGKEVPIPLPYGNWCAICGSYAMYSSLLPGDVKPHGYRVGVVEIISDMQKLGSFRDKKEVLSNNYDPKVGDAVFFDRSRPNDPSTAWYRHFARIKSISSDGFEAISGNSNGKWRVTNHKFNQPTLIGFGEYPSATTVYNPDQSTIDWESFDILALAPLEDTGDKLDASDFWNVFDGGNQS